MNKNIDYDNINYNLVIKSFLNSALSTLGSFKPKSRTEMNCLADAIICMRHLTKEQNKYTEWDTLRGNIKKLIEFSAGNKYYNRVYFAMNQVIVYMSQYYKAPENFFKQQRLLESVRKYWVAVTRNPVQKMLYKMMSQQRFVQKASR